MTPEQLWNHGEWMLKAYAEKQRKARKQKYRREENWSVDDFDVRHNGETIESFNKHTGRVLYTYPAEAFAEREAWNDIHEEFGRA
jgi:hypothetical protein